MITMSKPLPNVETLWKLDRQPIAFTRPLQSGDKYKVLGRLAAQVMADSDAWRQNSPGRDMGKPQITEHVTSVTELNKEAKNPTQAGLHSVFCRFKAVEPALTCEDEQKGKQIRSQKVTSMGSSNNFNKNLPSFAQINFLPTNSNNLKGLSHNSNTASEGEHEAIHSCSISAPENTVVSISHHYPSCHSLASLKRCVKKVCSWGMVSPMMIQVGRNQDGKYEQNTQIESQQQCCSKPNEDNLIPYPIFIPKSKLAKNMQKRKLKKRPLKNPAENRLFLCNSMECNIDSNRLDSLKKPLFGIKSQMNNGDTLYQRLKCLSLKETDLEMDKKEMGFNLEIPEKMKGQKEIKAKKPLDCLTNHPAYRRTFWPQANKNSITNSYSTSKRLSLSQRPLQCDGLDTFGKYSTKEILKMSDNCSESQSQFFPPISHSGSLLTVPRIIPKNSPPPSPQRHTSEARDFILSVPYIRCVPPRTKWN